MFPFNYAMVGGAPEAYSSRHLCVCYSAAHFSLRQKQN